MDIMVNLSDDCDWDWSDWMEPLTKAAIKHADIKAIDIYVDNVDEDYISLRIKELDTVCGEILESDYLLYYVDAAESLHRNLLFFYILYRSEGEYSTVQDYGAYQIVRDQNAGRCYALDI